jgi:hypothetical protein|tara:strand:- start:9327 stop:9497 length:171 start_codon:yes stop_codon:yes gene_type:complete
MKKRTLNELRQVKTYGYTTPSPSKEKKFKQKEHLYTNKNETVYLIDGFHVSEDIKK